MAFSDVLLEFKERVGWTEQQIGDALGVARPTVNQWINKKSSPSLKQLPALAKLLRRDWMELAAMIVGEEVGNTETLRPLQSSLLAQSRALSDEELTKIMAMVEVLFPRGQSDKPEKKP